MPDAARGMVADIKRVFGGDFRVVRAEGWIADLRLACFDAGDGDGAPRLAHGLKGIANMLGARLVAALADETDLCL